MGINLLDTFTAEQIAKAKACCSTEEILRLAKEEGIELTDEQLEAISGSGCDQSSGGNTRRKKEM